MSGNRWLQHLSDNPGHSQRYIERFATMAAEGHDLHGEARFIDAMAPRGASILDAGSGTGRVGGQLASLGHTVVGVDLDPILVDAARQQFPDSTWLVGDLSELDLTADEPDLSLQLGGTDRAPAGLPSEFDVIVSAGNVMAFLDPATRRGVLERLGRHLHADGRVVIAFGAGRDYGFSDFFDDAEAAGLTLQLALSTWDLRPFSDASDFLVAVFSGPAPDPLSVRR